MSDGSLATVTQAPPPHCGRDAMQLWLGERVRVDPGAVTQLRHLCGDFRAWAKDNGLPWLDAHKFAKQLAKFRFRNYRVEFVKINADPARDRASERWAIKGLALVAAPLRQRPKRHLRDYTGDQTFLAWLKARCLCRVEATTLTSDLYSDFVSWAQEEGTCFYSPRLMVMSLMRRGLERWRSPDGRRGLRGIALLHAPAEETEMDQRDTIDRWFAERCIVDPQAVSGSLDLYRDYRAWAAGRVYVSSVHAVVKRLLARGAGRWKHPRTRQRGLIGVRLRRPEDAPGAKLAPASEGDLVEMAKSVAAQ